MKEIKLSTGVYLLVEVPEDASDIQFHEQTIYNKPKLTYHIGSGTDDYDIIRETLPEGSYEYEGLCSELTEEQWSGIFGYTPLDPKAVGYFLVESNSMKPNTTVIMRKI